MATITSETTPSAVTIVGVGNMGVEFARNLSASGVKVTLWNRTRAKLDVAFPHLEKLDKLTDVNARDVVLTLTSNDAALEAVVFGDAHSPGFGDSLGAGGIHLCCATISPDLSKKLAAFHAAHGTHFVASPVFGRPEAAAARRLISVIAGAPEGRATASALMPLLSWKVVEVGDEAWQANVLKLAGNFQIMAAMEMMAEAFALAEKAGVPRDVSYDLYCGGLFSNPVIMQNYGRMIAGHTYTPVGFSAENGLKDSGLVVDTASKLRVPMPLASIVHHRTTRMVACGRTEEDWAAFARTVSEDAGLPTDRISIPRPLAAVLIPSASSSGGGAAVTPGTVTAPSAHPPTGTGTGTPSKD